MTNARANATSSGTGKEAKHEVLADSVAEVRMVREVDGTEDGRARRDARSLRAVRKRAGEIAGRADARLAGSKSMTLEFHAVICPMCHGTGKGETYDGCEYCGGTGRIVIREREKRGVELWKVWALFTFVVCGLAALLVWLTRH